MTAATTYQRKAVEFYTIELSNLADGSMFVAMAATGIDEEEPQLLTQEITSERVFSLEAALALIERGLSGSAERS